MNRHLQKILWFTGLSGSGKSTLSKEIFNKLNQKNLKSIRIDGDSFRNKKKYKKSFSKKNIIINNNLIIEQVKKIRNKYDFTIVSVISPLKVTREKAKKQFGDDYMEILIKCSIKGLLKRDTKGLYKLAKENRIKNLIGYNSKIIYEKTRYKKVIINTETENINQSLNIIISKIEKKFNVKI